MRAVPSEPPGFASDPGPRARQRRVRRVAGGRGSAAARMRVNERTAAARSAEILARGFAARSGQRQRLPAALHPRGAAHCRSEPPQGRLARDTPDRTTIIFIMPFVVSYHITVRHAESIRNVGAWHKTNRGAMRTTCTTRIVSYRIVSYRIVLFRSVPFRSVPFRVSFRFVSYRIVSYRMQAHTIRVINIIMYVIYDNNI